MITVVTGLGRCGSSLLMQMLSAGGLPCIGKYPAFEDIRTVKLKDDYQWLITFNGAVKVLDAHTYWPEIVPARFIALFRDQKQQAKSTVKMLKAIKATPDNVGATRSLIKQNERALRRWLKKRERVLSLRFESILREPERVIDSICAFLCEDLDKKAMRQAVVARGSDCLKGLLEVQQLRSIKR